LIEYGGVIPAGRRGAWGVGVSALWADLPLGSQKYTRTTERGRDHRTKEMETEQTAKGGIWGAAATEGMVVETGEGRRQRREGSGREQEERRGGRERGKGDESQRDSHGQASVEGWHGGHSRRG
jgi:hypothetical protein